MNIFKKIMKVISLILLFSTIICGLYINASKATLENYNSSVSFHLAIAIATVIFVTITFFLPDKKMIK